jgi:hypothetical protein
MAELEIEAPPEQLEELRQQLIGELGSDLDIQEVSSIGAGELREPVLVAIIVALGGPAVVKGVVTVVERWMKHNEEMRKLEIAKLRLLEGSIERDLTVDELLRLSEESRR